MFSDETGFGGASPSRSPALLPPQALTERCRSRPAGNGEYDPERQSEPTDLNSFEWPLVTPVIVANASNTTTVPRTGTGGGCVTGGPFSESQGWFVNVGLGESPASPLLTERSATDPSSWPARSRRRLDDLQPALPHARL